MPTSKDYNFSDYKAAMQPAEKEYFKTPAALLEKGMCICSDCGRIASTDFRFCKSCRTEILIIREK